MKPDNKIEFFDLSDKLVQIGRSQSNDLILEAPEVSDKHALIAYKNGSYYLQDRHSKGGTFLKNARVSEVRELCDQDEVRIGNFIIRFEAIPNAMPPMSSALQEAHQSQPPRSIKISELLKEKLKTLLVEKLNLKNLNLEALNDEELEVRARKELEGIIEKLDGQLPEDPEYKKLLIKQVIDEALKHGPIEDLLHDPQITEVMVNGKDQIYVERAGKIEELTDRSFQSDEQVIEVIKRIIAPLNRRIDISMPLVDARLKNGSRVNAIIPPLAIKGPAITIRKFKENLFGIDEMLKLGTLSEPMAIFLKACVKARKNIIISGGTGSGKTTLLNALSWFIPEDERIITIEDSAELRLNQRHVVALESRPANIQGEGAITIRDLVINALRMRPDRIVVGECRGGEALDMLQAMNTGHDGSLTTAHANSPRDLLFRLETMVLMSGMELPLAAIRNQISSAIDIIVHQARFAGGCRKITHITEVTGLQDNNIALQDIFLFVQTGINSRGEVEGYHTPTGNVPTFFSELKLRGIELPKEIFQVGE
jgi:pilus assembly protein CpaF